MFCLFACFFGGNNCFSKTYITTPPPPPTHTHTHTRAHTQTSFSSYTHTPSIGESLTLSKRSAIWFAFSVPLRRHLTTLAKSFHSACNYICCCTACCLKSSLSPARACSKGHRNRNFGRLNLFLWSVLSRKLQQH